MFDTIFFHFFPGAVHVHSSSANHSGRDERNLTDSFCFATHRRDPSSVISEVIENRPPSPCLEALDLTMEDEHTGTASVDHNRPQTSVRIVFI